MWEEEATEEAEEEKAAGAELKTKTTHNDVGKKEQNGVSNPFLGKPKFHAVEDVLKLYHINSIQALSWSNVLSFN